MLAKLPVSACVMSSHKLLFLLREVCDYLRITCERNLDLEMPYLNAWLTILSHHWNTDVPFDQEVIALLQRFQWVKGEFNSEPDKRELCLAFESTTCVNYS